MDRVNKLQGYTKRPSQAGLAAYPSDPMGWSLTDEMGGECELCGGMIEVTAMRKSKKTSLFRFELKNYKI